MDLRSLSQEVIREVSSEVISFQLESHSLISWVKSSDESQDYRNFEDMHHGITLSSCYIFLVYLTFIKLLERFIKVFAASLSLEELQVSLTSSYNFKSKEVALSFTANLMQINFA